MPSIDEKRVDVHRDAPIPAGSPGAAIVKSTIEGQAINNIVQLISIPKIYERIKGAIAMFANALPSIFVTAPNEITKSATSSRIPYFLALAKLMGNVTKDEIVPAAKIAVGR